MSDAAKRIAIVSIQRDRGPWIVEWLAFHLLAGFNQFFIYTHRCTDDSTDILVKLARHLPIVVHQISTDDRPQLTAYQHAYNSYGGDVDWMAFIDGDEFLYSPQYPSIGDALAEYEQAPLSALGAYWICYGSNGHLQEPKGLILENYPRHSSVDFLPNRHIKSIVKGRQQGIHTTASHLFETPNGTFDELLRPITNGWMQQTPPSHQKFRINHYVVQSYEYFRSFKQNSGAADWNANMVRPDEWYFRHDRNECDDGGSYNFLLPLKLKVQQLQALLEQETRATAPTVQPAQPAPKEPCQEQPKRPIRQIVKNYKIVGNVKPLPENHQFNGNSAANKVIVEHIFAGDKKRKTVLDIGFGVGSLGDFIRANPKLKNWEIDGIDGFDETCSNLPLFKKKIYRNVWHGLAQELAPKQLASYDLICLFDVIEHLPPQIAKELLASLLDYLGDHGRLAISTPLWFYPQDQQKEGDLEEHLIGVPANSIMGLKPIMYSIGTVALVGNFVFTRDSLRYIDNFVPTTDRNFSLQRGLEQVQALGLQVDNMVHQL